MRVEVYIIGGCARDYRIGKACLTCSLARFDPQHPYGPSRQTDVSLEYRAKSDL